jgi:hypothetical protein
MASPNPESQPAQEEKRTDNVERWLKGRIVTDEVFQPEGKEDPNQYIQNAHELEKRAKNLSLSPCRFFRQVFLGNHGFLLSQNGSIWPDPALSQT